MVIDRQTMCVLAKHVMQLSEAALVLSKDAECFTERQLVAFQGLLAELDRVKEILTAVVLANPSVVAVMVGHA